jgi:hypothetical protein
MAIRKNLQKQIESIYSNIQNMWLIFAGLFMTIFTMNFIIYGFFILTIALVFFGIKKYQIGKLIKTKEYQKMIERKKYKKIEKRLKRIEKLMNKILAKR